MKLIPKSRALYIWSPEPIEVQSSRNEGEKMDPYFSNGPTIDNVNCCYNLKDVGTYNYLYFFPSI